VTEECGTTKRARRFAVAPDFLCGQEIGGSAQRWPPFSLFLPDCVLSFLPSAVCV